LRFFQRKDGIAQASTRHAKGDQPHCGYSQKITLAMRGPSNRGIHINWPTNRQSAQTLLRKTAAQKGFAEFNKKTH
jgi:hypothetical protein